jgi:predicted amidohydrolase YtcJ
MCRACVSQLYLRDELFSNGSAKLFDGLSIEPTRRNFMALSAASLTAASAIGSVPSAFAADGGADTIFVNGTVVASAGKPAVNALAIGQGKILASGSKASVMGLKTASTKIVDLDGRTLLPGLMDSHHHTIMAAIVFELLHDVGYSVYPTRRQLIDGLRAIASSTPPGQWITGAKFDNLLQGGDFTKEELDSVSTQHPIFIWYVNSHDACVNSVAFKVANIPDDLGPLPAGGRLGRGPDGQYNGMVYEEPAMLKFAVYALPKITPQLAAKAAADYLRAVAATGTTFVHETGTLRSEWIAPFSKISSSLACRTSASIMYGDQKGLEPYRSLGFGAKAAQLPNTLFSLYAIKIVADGSPQTETAAYTQPFLDSANKGSPNFSPDQLKAMVAEVKAFGMPVQIHCSGDYTVDIALDAIEAAYGNSTTWGINRIEHATITRPDQFVRMKKLNVEPTLLMNNVRYYGHAYRDQIFGPARTNFSVAANACVQNKINFSLHTDAPCSPIGPLSLMETAVTRRCVIDNSIIGQDQAISVDQALKALTIDAARQVGLADRLGTLDKGKEADITILEDNPYKVAPDKISKIKVSETWVAGQQKYAT